MSNSISYSYRDLWMVAALVCVAVVLGFYPADRTVWCVEMVWAVGLWAILLLTRRKFRFSTPAYLCFFVWTVLQIVGAHYTFEHVPMEWLMKPLGLVRNPYDRIAHFAVGWFAFPLAELFFRKNWVKSAGFAAFFAVMSTVAMAGIWELVEWWYAVVDGGAAGAAFLGSQGDVWDAQKDILCDTLGAICASTLFLWLVRRDYWIVKGPGGIPILNPENEAPTMTWTLKHNRIWDVVGIVVSLAAISAIAGLLWLCAIGIRNLESRYLWAGTPRAIPLIDGTNLPIRDFKWDELRLGDVTGMEERYSTRVGKIISPLGEVAPKVDVAKYMKELRLPAVSFRPPATLDDALLYLQSASVPFDGSGQVVLFALMPKKEGEIYPVVPEPVVPEMRAEDILFADILRLVCESTDVWYGIRDDGVVVVKPRDWTCDADCKPGKVWLLEEGTWPSGDATESEDNISSMTEKE